MASLEIFRRPLFTSVFSEENGHLHLHQNKRIHLKTDQKWVMSEGHLSDLIRLQWLDRPEGTGGAKPALVWQNERGEDKAAIIGHYKANDPTRIDHRHMSIETTMSPTGANPGELFTRLEFPFDADVCEIQTHDSNFTVENGVLRVMGGNGSNRDILLGRNYSKEDAANQTPEGTPDYSKVFVPRWAVRASSASETGGQAGADFAIVRYNDAGVAMDTPFGIKRSNGFVGIGTNAPTAPLDVNNNKIRIRNAATPASGTATGNQGEIVWDTNNLYICTATNTWKKIALVAM